MKTAFFFSIKLPQKITGKELKAFISDYRWTEEAPLRASVKQLRIIFLVIYSENINMQLN